MTIFDLLAMEPAKAAPIPERNQLLLLYAICIAAMTQVRVPQRWLLVGWVGVVLLAATLAF